MELQDLAKKVLAKPLKHGEFVKAIVSEQKVSDSTAKNRIKAMVALDVIKKAASSF